MNALVMSESNMFAAAVGGAGDASTAGSLGAVLEERARLYLMRAHGLDAETAGVAARVAAERTLAAVPVGRFEDAGRRVIEEAMDIVGWADKDLAALCQSFLPATRPRPMRLQSLAPMSLREIGTRARHAHRRGQARLRRLAPVLAAGLVLAAALVVPGAVQ